MDNIRIKFKKPRIVTPYKMSKGNIIPGYRHIDINMIFYINMDGNFRRKEGKCW